MKPTQTTDNAARPGIATLEMKAPGVTPPPAQADLSVAFDSNDERLQELPTPALVINATIVRRNLDRLADYAARHHLAVRPHAKTHKSRMLGRLQLQAGAVGMTVAKVGEAEQMAEITGDILLAYPAVDSNRCARIAQLSRRLTIRVAVDTTAAVTALATATTAAKSTLGLLVEMDVGMGRTGVGSALEVLKLAQLIDQTPGLRFDGLMCFPGHINLAPDQQAPLLAAVDARLREALDLLAQHGLPAKIVSGGSTPTAYQSHQVKAYNEIRPGTYIFNDMNTVRSNCCRLEDCSARIICTVVRDAVKNQFVIDAGSKTLTSDRCGPAPDSGHGLVMEYPDAKITRLTEEHGQVDASLCAQRPKVGERVTVIPNHICPCINLQDSFWWLEPGAAPQPSKVDARGKLS